MGSKSIKNDKIFQLSFKFQCVVFFLISVNVFSQNVNISADLPNISPPSPTVAALMKFEEVPVDHYTGIPDISIPLYNSETTSKDITIAISFKYHPSSIIIKETAAYTGLGWNLIAGGTVSRTVRGLPDEILNKGNSSNNRKRIGIYHDGIESNNANYFYDRINLTANSPQDQIDRAQEFLFGAFEKGYFDSEHDLYQYNFMGHTGRFYIKKITTQNDPLGAQGNYVIVKLDNDNDLRIQLNSPSLPERNFNGFTFYDDKGYVYLFSTTNAETTYENVSNRSIEFGHDIGSLEDELYNVSYNSSYQLSSIADNNNQQLVSFSYQNATEVINTTTTEFNFPASFGAGGAFSLVTAPIPICQVEGLLPRRFMSAKTSTITTKKLSEINVVNKAKIKFALTPDRDDSNINQNAVRLTGMTVEDIYGKIIKQYSFEHDYATITNTELPSTNVRRLILTSVIETEVGTTKQIRKNLTYNNQNTTGTYNTREDFWGYYKRTSPTRETDPQSCMTGALEQIVLPTGGSIFFTWGPNTYSYIGDRLLTDFTRDDYNGPDITVPIEGNPDDPSIPHIGTLNPTFQESSRTAYFIPDSKGVDGSFTINVVGSSDVINIDAAGINGLNDGTAARSGGVKLNKYAQYEIKFIPYGFPAVYTPGQTVNVFFDYTSRVTGEQWQYGGGIRIDKISYNDTLGTTPVKEKIYNYNFFNNPNRSSGSLVFSKPIFKYPRTLPVRVSGCNSTISSATYDTETSFNNLVAIRTKGSDVGYKNVTAWETGNGKSEYTYTTPIDYPENDYTLRIPAVATHNYDYKRGLLTNEKQYKQKTATTYTLLNEKIFNYPLESMDAHLVVTGKRSRAENINFRAGAFETYAAYKSCVQQGFNCQTGGIGLTLFVYSDYDVWEAYGWPKLTSKINKDYFYENGSEIAKVVSTTENYEYNTTNKKVSKITATNSVGENLITDYIYDLSLIGLIKCITTKRDHAIVKTMDISYSNTEWGSANTSRLPSTISQSKGTDALESRLRFTRYDELSNPLEASLEDGTPVCYIWGYNNSKPIAIIQNATYASLSQTLINDAKTISNRTSWLPIPANFYTTKETDLLASLASLRASLPATAQVTTFTYLSPLLGPSTIVDARGSKTTYTYDGFGRLVQAKDNQNKIVGENIYNYKPQE